MMEAKEITIEEQLSSAKFQLVKLRQEIISDSRKINIDPKIVSRLEGYLVRLDEIRRVL